MVDEKPTDRIDSTPTNAHHDTQVADRLRDGLSTQAPQVTPTDSTASTDKIPAATALSASKADVTVALGDIQALTSDSRPSPNSALTTLQQRMLENKVDSSIDAQIQNSAALRRTVAFGEGA